MTNLSSGAGLQAGMQIKIACKLQYSNIWEVCFISYITIYYSINLSIYIYIKRIKRQKLCVLCVVKYIISWVIYIGFIGISNATKKGVCVHCKYWSHFCWPTIAQRTTGHNATIKLFSGYFMPSCHVTQKTNGRNKSSPILTHC